VIEGKNLKYQKGFSSLAVNVRAVRECKIYGFEQNVII
jgi:hypothetical protein